MKTAMPAAPRTPDTTVPERLDGGRPWRWACAWWLVASLAHASPLALRHSLPAPSDTACPAPSTAVRALLSDRPSVRGGPAQLFVASDRLPGTTGQVRAYRVQANAGGLAVQPAWGQQADGSATGTGDLLDALGPATVLTERVIFTDDGGGRLFLWDRLGAGPGSPQAWLQGADDALQGQARLNHLRGERRQERRQGGTLNDRDSRQGAIDQAGLWYTDRPADSHGLPGYRAFASQYQARAPMLYAGGNDGMLHGFAAADGSERLAYVPRGTYPQLRALAQSAPGSPVPLTVNGPVLSGDANLGSSALPDWRTLLVGALGTGGKGYFVLDVSNPAEFTASEASAARTVRRDHSDGSDPDIGHLTGHALRDEFNPHRSPQITLLNDGRWAVLLGNGVNSTNEDPVLLVQYLDQGSPSLRKIPAATGTSGAAQGNGLSTPRPVDLNGDGRADVVYAGDLQGQLWKFDLLSHDPAAWGVAFSAPRCTLCTPLYHAQGPQGQAQAISAAPVVRTERSSGGLMVAFGTGRRLTPGDETDTSVQTLYAVLDRSRYQPHPQVAGTLRLDPRAPSPLPVAGGRSALRERRLQSGVANPTAGTPRPSGEQARLSYTGPEAVQGWYLDLPEPGERVLQAPEPLDGSQILQVRSLVPAALRPGTGPCPATDDQGFLTLLGVTQGLAPPLALVNTDGTAAPAGPTALTAQRAATQGPWWSMACPQGGCQVEGSPPQTARTLAPLPKPPRTLHWRQLQ